MAKKIKLTRPELKRQRDALARFERYLPMLKLKQQQLQITLRDIELRHRQAQADVADAKRRFQPYEPLLGDRAGVDVRGLAKPSNVETSRMNIAGVLIPVLKNVEFPPAQYSLFSTPAWVDQAIERLRAISRLSAEADVLAQQHTLLTDELTKIIQRVNLFEKIKIPESREAIRIIRIRLGDEMTAAVGRAKMAKGRLQADNEQGGPAIEEPTEEVAT